MTDSPELQVWIIQQLRADMCLLRDLAPLELHLNCLKVTCGSRTTNWPCLHYVIIMELSGLYINR